MEHAMNEAKSHMFEWRTSQLPRLPGVDLLVALRGENVVRTYRFDPGFGLNVLRLVPGLAEVFDPAMNVILDESRVIGWRPKAERL